MTFSTMNTIDLRTLLTAPTVSRATFFAYYLGTANILAETPDTDFQLPAGQPAPEKAPVATEPVVTESIR
ncbi:MAG: hypothetical protein M3Y54_06765 [Bacteroidota bacterium]|nr:hypothetical protein [Bacteroidota bacterium]